jgi:hypothetical protein
VRPVRLRLHVSQWARVNPSEKAGAFAGALAGAGIGPVCAGLLMEFAKHARALLKHARAFVKHARVFVSHTQECNGHTREFQGHTREFQGHTWEFQGHTREFHGHAREFHGHAREFHGHARVFVKHTWVFLMETAIFHGKARLFARDRFFPKGGRPEMPWDTGTWDSSTWDSDPISPPKLKPKNKPMKRPRYYPVAIGDQISWLQNSKKLPNYTATLPLVSGDVTAVMLDVDNAIYALSIYRPGVAAFPDAAYECIREALHGDGSTPIAWLAFAAPAGAPAAVAQGCLDRIFTYIEDAVKKAAGYNKTIGLDLLIETAPAPAPSALALPDFTMRVTSGGKLEVVWVKGQFDGVKLQFDLGAAGMQSDVDLRPNYTLNWLPATGTSAIIKVRLMYILKGVDTGNWSDWKSWTLTGV